MVTQLNKDARAKRAADSKQLILSECMSVLRNRVVVVNSAEQLKSYMECQQSGLVARVVVVDSTMPSSRQAGSKSRSVCLAMSKSVQEDLAKAIKILPATPVVGSVLIRSGNQSVDVLESCLKNTHAHRRSMVVPVVVPEKDMRYLRSGVRRANGPNDDDASGIDFVSRTIGKRHFNEETGTAVDQEGEDLGADDGADGEESDNADVEDDADPGDKSALDKAFAEMTDPMLMPAKMLKELFGGRAADIKNILFQHSTRIGIPASFLEKNNFFQWRKTETAAWRKYRKGQVHPSVYISAISSILNSSNVPLTNNEMLVDLTGGTPEVLVAGIVLGFKKVAFVADGSAEETMMQIPTQEEERSNGLKYDECSLR